jgi:hypothetical protein
MVSEYRDAACIIELFPSPRTSNFSRATSLATSQTFNVHSANLVPSNGKINHSSAALQISAQCENLAVADRPHPIHAHAFLSKKADVQVTSMR